MIHFHTHTRSVLIQKVIIVNIYCKFSNDAIRTGSLLSPIRHCSHNEPKKWNDDAYEYHRRPQAFKLVGVWLFCPFILVTATAMYAKMWKEFQHTMRATPKAPRRHDRRNFLFSDRWKPLLTTCYCYCTFEGRHYMNTAYAPDSHHVKKCSRLFLPKLRNTVICASRAIFYE